LYAHKGGDRTAKEGGQNLNRTKTTSWEKKRHPLTRTKLEPNSGRGLQWGTLARHRRKDELGVKQRVRWEPGGSKLKTAKWSKRRCPAKSQSVPCLKIKKPLWGWTPTTLQKDARSRGKKTDDSRFCQSEKKKKKKLVDNGKAGGVNQKTEKKAHLGGIKSGDLETGLP